MAKNWHVVINGDRLGPFSSSDLTSLAESGKLKPEHKVWKVGLDDWVPASKIKGLFPPVLPSPPISPKPAPLPPPLTSAATSFVWSEPSLVDVDIPDDDASEAWRNRECPLNAGLGLLSGVFKKSIQQAVFNHRQRLSRHFENGREILLDDVLDRFENAYSNRGFKVQRYASAIVVVKQSSGNGIEVDASQKASSDVGTLTNGIIRVSEQSDSWVVSLTAEFFFWPRVLQQFIGAAGLACIALIFFWPCLCCLPLAFHIDADKVKASLQEDVTITLDKLASEVA